MKWSFQSDRPIYAQLMEQMTAAIVTGGYSPGQKLEPVRELALEAGVNPNTMQRALSELEREGLVYSQRTTGRFVTEDRERLAEARRSLAREQTAIFRAAMERLGYSLEEIVIFLQEEGE